MIDESDVSAVTEQDVREFIAKKNIRISCAECQHPTSALSFSRQGRTPSIISFDDDADFQTAIIHSYWQLVCVNCGNVRMFERSSVAAFKLEAGGS